MGFILLYPPEAYTVGCSFPILQMDKLRHTPVMLPECSDHGFYRLLITSSAPGPVKKNKNTKVGCLSSLLSFKTLPHKTLEFFFSSTLSYSPRLSRTSARLTSSLKPSLSSTACAHLSCLFSNVQHPVSRTLDQQL